jgi:hypothetical protein
MKYEFTQHARHAMQARGVLPEWVEQTIDSPELRQPDPNDDSVERFFRRIPEHCDRVLRVAVNTRV